jgi:hypothetical protein
LILDIVSRPEYQSFNEGKVVYIKLDYIVLIKGSICAVALINDKLPKIENRYPHITIHAYKDGGF